jgi:hypothetical protein
MSVLTNIRKFQQTKAMGIVRVTAYGMFVAAAIGTCSMHRAKADITEQTFVLGRDLSKVADLLDHTYEVRLNGETIFMSQTESRLSMQEILDKFEQTCRENPGVMAQDWKNIPNDTIKTKDGDLVAKLGVVRKQTEHEGMVGCLAKSDGMSPSLTEAWKNFIKTGELGYVGKLRYAFVKGPSQSGRYSVTTLWTENSFNLMNIMPPESGDAPGSDSPTAGRPPNGKRFLTAEIVGTPYALRIYESDAAPEVVYGKYDATMVSDDWLAFTKDSNAHMYYKDGVETLVMASRNDDGKTVVTIGELGGEQLRTR